MSERHRPSILIPGDFKTRPDVPYVKKVREVGQNTMTAQLDCLPVTWGWGLVEITDAITHFTASDVGEEAPSMY